MVYPPPPGTNSLPARPPVTTQKSGFKSAFEAANHTATTSSSSYSSASTQGFNAGTTSYPGAPGSSQYGPSYNSYDNRPAPGVNHTAPRHSYLQQHHQQPQQPPRHHQSQHYNQHQSRHLGHPGQPQPKNYGYQNYGQSPQYSAPPSIVNPFPTPGTTAGDYDPEMAAQIAQWQSAYVTREPDKDGKMLPAVDYPKPEVVEAAKALDKKKTVMREGGGKKWTDETLLEWDPSHLRLFVGNLAGETTDESLLKAFSRWKSVQKSRVIRDKRTTKSKGFGFVSFSDSDDFFQAAKEMNGKYIQSHPVVVRKATTDIKVTNVKDKDRNHKKNLNNKKRGGNPGGNQDHGGGYEPHLGPIASGGITKSGQKTKNGLRLLG